MDMLNKLMIWRVFDHGMVASSGCKHHTLLQSERLFSIYACLFLRCVYMCLEGHSGDGTFAEVSK